jgi:hypothetical protein
MSLPMTGDSFDALERHATAAEHVANRRHAFLERVLAPGESAGESLVTLTFARWNRIASWLRSGRQPRARG